MSFLSRLFRKTPSPQPTPVAPSAPTRKADSERPKPGAADRAQAAAAEEAALRLAIEAGDLQAVARQVVAGSSTRIRQAAAEAIDDPDLLRQLIREVRGGNDKSVYKILTGKRDALIERARQQAQVQADIGSVIDDLERHSQRPFDGLFSQRLDELEQRWAALAADADADACSRAQRWIDRARGTIAEHARLLAAEALRQQAAADAAARAAEQAQAQAQALREQQAEASAAADEAAEPDAATPIPTPSDAPPTGQPSIRQIGEWLRKARGALRDGNTARAAALRRDIDKQLADASPLPANLVSQLQQLDQQLDELKDWKNFSVAPKRGELIAEMELLIGAAADPQTLADQIRALRDEWRTLGKGAGEQLDPVFEADQQRFQAAAEKAYQPCQAYFAEQALIRDENLRQRDTVLAQLTAFEATTDWAQPDWPAVIKALRESRQAWRQHAAVDRLAGKPQQDAFTALTADLQARIDTEYSRNLAQKEALIARAAALLASDDSRKAIDAVKKLQRDWQAVGLVPRDADQRLWATFRQHCDALFQKREQESAAYAASLEGNKTKAMALCAQIERIAALEGTELLALAGERFELRKAFEALGEFPRAESRALRQRLDQALDRVEQSLARQQARSAEQSWSDLFAAADQVRAYRFAVAQGLDTEARERLRAALETFLTAVPRWPKGGLEAIKRALADDHATDLAANESALKRLCIRAEILSGEPTPADDQALRRDYQLQRLVKGMGQGLGDDDTSLDAMALAWVAVGPVAAAVYEPLLQRFRRCRARRTS